MPTNIFLSYSPADAAVAIALSQLLRAPTGPAVDVWLDPNPGAAVTAELAERVATAIKDHKVFVLLLSPAALASERVQSDVAHFAKLYSRAKKQRVLVPILVQPLDFAALDVATEPWKTLAPWPRFQRPDGQPLPGTAKTLQGVAAALVKYIRHYDAKTRVFSLREAGDRAIAVFDRMEHLRASAIPTPAPSPLPESGPAKPARNIERLVENLALNGAVLRDLPRQVAHDLQQGGILDQRLPGYEERQPQIRMAEAVATSLATGEHTLIEAGTGTGKSIAYLLPIVRSGKVALVATANKALQEQLFYKDIPFLVENVQPVRAALVKGMANYLCHQHLAEQHTVLLEEARDTGRVSRSEALERLDELTNDDTFDGDLDVLTFDLPTKLRAEVAANSDDCAWNKCPYFGGCYVRQMRDKAQTAQIVVINHTLLLLDVLMDNWLLPERDVIVIDEAHHLEEEATRAFTVTVTPRRVELILRERRLKEHCSAPKIEAAITANVLTWGRLEELVRFGNRSRAPLAEPLEEGLRLASALADIAATMKQNKPEKMDERDEQLFDKLTRRIAALVVDLRLVFGEKNPAERVYYAEREPARRGRDGMISVSAAPLSVTEILKEKLFDKISVIGTSATLAIDGKFDFYRKRVGVTTATEMVLPLAFDYSANALLYVPRLKHEPIFGKDNGPYMDELAGEMEALVRASQGRAFLLFSSQRALGEVWDRIEPDLFKDGFSLFRQGDGLGRAELLRRFRSEPRAILFGLKSFWEGVDVAGEALSLVAIDKLPFAPPDDPVHEARVNKMKELSENWFGDYVLPQAILMLKQGVGRLLRSRTDRGVLAILDSRILTKGYGRQVVFALPPAERTTQIDKVRAFFAAEG